MRFDKLSPDLFKQIQLGAGVFLSSFTETDTKATIQENIIGATKGGANFNANHTFSDFGEDIDNCPKNTMELMKHDSWDITMSGTYISVTAEVLRSLIGTADIDSSTNKIVPRNDPKSSDFQDFYWVGDYSDENNETSGGLICIHIMNALNTGGFQFQSTDRAKGEFAFTYTAHFSIEDVDTVPFDVVAVTGTAA